MAAISASIVKYKNLKMQNLWWVMPLNRSLEELIVIIVAPVNNCHVVMLMLMLVWCVTVERSDNSKWQVTTRRQRNSFLSALLRSSLQGDTTRDKRLSSNSLWWLILASIGVGCIRKLSWIDQTYPKIIHKELLIATPICLHFFACQCKVDKIS